LLTKVWGTEFAALDLETTGLDPLNDRIVEAAAVIFRGSEVIDTFETLVNPGVRITSALTAIHGITNSMVKGAPAPAEAVSTLAGFVGERPLVIQNAPFDMGFIDTIRRESFSGPLDNDLFDTCRLAPVIFPGLPSYSLGSLARALGVPKGRSHRALDDSLAAMGIFLKCMEKIDPAGNIEYERFERDYSFRSLLALERSPALLQWPSGFEAIREAFEVSGIDPVGYTGRTRGRDEAFPWEVVDAGVSRSFLWEERLKALAGELTPDCRGGACNLCGWQGRGCPALEPTDGQG